MVDTIYEYSPQMSREFSYLNIGHSILCNTRIQDCLQYKTEYFQIFLDKVLTIHYIAKQQVDPAGIEPASSRF